MDVHNAAAEVGDNALTTMRTKVVPGLPNPISATPACGPRRAG
jgi:hypothetical protein